MTSTQASRPMVLLRHKVVRFAVAPFIFGKINIIGSAAFVLTRDIGFKILGFDAVHIVSTPDAVIFRRMDKNAQARFAPF